MYFILLINLISNIISQNQNIRFSFVIFRHGARSPYYDLTDDFIDIFGYKWEGKKELTGIGQRQHFLLGNRHRKRYIEEYKLINEKYDPREIYVISTDSNRTIMSAQCELLGIYLGNGNNLNDEQVQNANPPNNISYFDEEKEKLGNKVLPYNIEVPPIHQFFVKDHTMQLHDVRNCKGHKKIYETNEKRKEVDIFINNFINKYGQFFIDKMKEKPKEKDLKKFYTYIKVYTVLDTLLCIYTDGKNMEKFENKTKELIDLSYEFFNFDFIANNSENNIDLGIISMSPTFEKIINWMDLKIKKDKENMNYLGYDMPKLVLYSAHDSTVGAFEEFMYAVFKTSINYAYFASFANLELVKVNAGFEERDYEVYYYFDDKFIKNFNYKEFKEKVKKNLKNKEQIASYCQFEEKSNLSLVITILLTILLIVLLGLNYYVWIKRNKSSGEYKVSALLTEE